MKLEIISRHPDGDPHPHPLLFIHGAFTGAHIWDQHFLAWFAEQGYTAHALSLRGHGNSDGRDKLRWWSLDDYVMDLTRAVQRLDNAPVLIGHSMGGMVAQKYLEANRAAGLVLMASVPPHGLLASFFGLALGDPLLLQQLAMLHSMSPQLVAVDTVRRALFSESMPDHQVIEYSRLLQGESQQVGLDMLGLNPVRLQRHSLPPTLVVGAERDAFLTPGLVKATARRYGAEVEIFPDMAHAMMLEPGWQQVARRLQEWLRLELGPPYL